MDQYVYEHSGFDGRSRLAPNLWREHFDIFYLDQKMRCPDDVPFAQLCDRVGTNKITDEDVKYFESRIVQDKIPEELSNDNFKTGKVSIIVNFNEDREKINLEKLRALLPTAKEYTCLAMDNPTNSKYNEPPPGTTSKRKHKGRTVLHTNLIIREGAPVMLTCNNPTPRYKEEGLTNGAFGYIDFIQVSKQDPEVVEIIWVVFNHERVGKRHYKAEKRHLRPEEFEHLIHEDALPILPTSRPYQVEEDNKEYMRRQFALTLAYVMTGHKCQGSSRKIVIVDFRGSVERHKPVAPAAFYTAITRVTNGDNLFLRSFQKDFIRNDPRVENEIYRMRLLRNVKFKKVFIKEPIFTDNKEIKIGYININGLVESYHAQYLNGDTNLLNLDMIAVAETHLTAATSNTVLAALLNNWQVQYRFDSGDGIKHMGLLILTSKSATDFQHVENFDRDRQGQTQVQATSVLLSGILFTFVYMRTTPTISEAAWLQQKTLKSDYLLGDINCDPLDQNGKTLIDIIGGQKKIILRDSTTPQRKQLDHIFGRETDKVFAASYLNFISDHCAITLRISLSGAGFLDDERLKKESAPKRTSQTDAQTPIPQPPTPTKKRRC